MTTTTAVDRRTDFMVNTFVAEARAVAGRLDPAGPTVLAERARNLFPLHGFSLVAEARELARSWVLDDPSDLEALATLGIITAVLGLVAHQERRGWTQVDNPSEIAE